MLVSLKWLRDYVDDGEKSVDEMSTLLTKLGLEVDGVEYIAKEKSENIVAGYVKTAEQHPNADKLSLCEVDVGEEENLQIICGADNVAAGQKLLLQSQVPFYQVTLKLKKLNYAVLNQMG